MTELVPTVDGRPAATMLAHARALQAHDGRALDTAAAAEAAAAHRRDGRLTSSVVAGDRARRLHGQCEGARTPALEQIGGDHDLGVAGRDELLRFFTVSQCEARASG
jgi:hypothetical protein